MTETTKEFWTKELKPGDTWNARYAEDYIRHMCMCGKLFEVGMPEPLVKAFGFDGIEEEAKAATHEMLAIKSAKDNPYGFHLNHITSDKNVYSVFKNDIKEYHFDSKYTTKEEAEKRVAELGDAYVEHFDDESEYPFCVYVYNEEGTQNVRNQEAYGEFICDCDTLEEAEAKANEFDDAYVIENPSEDWWTVISNKTGKAVFNMMFPSPNRAIAFLYMAVKPKSWLTYLDAIDRKEKERGPVKKEKLVKLKEGAFKAEGD